MTGRDDDEKMSASSACAALRINSTQIKSDMDNWALLYQFENDRPNHFHEIRRLDEEVWIRTGRVSTWGAREIIKCNDLDQAHAKFVEAIDSSVAEGFYLYCRGHYDPRFFDFERLRVEIREGCRKAFTIGREERKGENVNAYGLVTDGSAMTIVSAMNSEEALTRKGAREDYVWNVFEWTYKGADEFLDPAYRMILPRVQDLPFELEFVDFISKFEECCVEALTDLDHEQFFGFGDARENVVLLFQVSDSDYIDHAMRRLNTSAMYRRFRAWYDSWA